MVVPSPSSRYEPPPHEPLPPPARKCVPRYTNPPCEIRHMYTVCILQGGHLYSTTHLPVLHTSLPVRYMGLMNTVCILQGGYLYIQQALSVRHRHAPPCETRHLHTVSYREGTYIVLHTSLPPCEIRPMRTVCILQGGASI